MPHSLVKVALKERSIGPSVLALSMELSLSVLASVFVPINEDLYPVAIFYGFDKCPPIVFFWRELEDSVAVLLAIPPLTLIGDLGGGIVVSSLAMFSSLNPLTVV